MAKRSVPDLDDREIDILDIGPIQHLRFKAEPGTITVLRGPNGVGKTQVLGAVDALVSGNGRLSGRDGTTGGTARGFGVKISVGRGGANRRSGELVVESIEDRLNIADLVDPGLKDPYAADSRRIRALVQLSGTTPSLALFDDLLEGGLDRLVTLLPETAAQETDLVEMAAKVKRGLEAHARKKEDEASGLKRDAEAKLATCEGIDLDAPHDRSALQSAIETSISTWQRLRSEREAGECARQKRDANTLRLDQLRDSRADKPGVADLASEAAAAEATWQDSRRNVDRLRAELAAAESDERLARQVHDSAAQTLDAGKADAAVMATLESLVSAPLPATPSAEAVAAAHMAVQSEKAAMETGVRVRDARKWSAEAETLASKARDAEESAEELRDAAKGTEDVLSRIVAGMGGPFKVSSEFRLIVPGTERGEEFFSELSHGERWKLALDVAIEAFSRAGKPGLLVIPQEAFEGLDGRNRRLIAEHIRGTDLSVITAEADHESEPSDEIEAEVFEPVGAA